MTAKTKLEEAKIYLEEIESEKENLKKLKMSISSFLERIGSIYDHSLEEVNQKSELGLTGKWGYTEFKERAKQTNNFSALRFLEWYDKQWEFQNEMKVPPLLRQIRNEDHHKKDLKFEIHVKQYPTDKRDFERPFDISLEKTGGKQFETVSEVMEAMEYSTQRHIIEWNRAREELGFPLIKNKDDLINKLGITFLRTIFLK